MPSTGIPVEAMPSGPGIVWSKGKGQGGNWSLRRVTTQDKISASDVNQLRNFIEQLWNHTHEYVDAVAVASTTTTTTC